MKKKRIWRTALNQVRGHWRAIGFLNILTVLQSCAQVAGAVATKFVVDAALFGNGKLLMWGLVLGGLLLAQVILHGIQIWCAGSATDRCAARMRQRLLAAAADSQEERLQQYHSGAMLSRGMEDVYTVCDGFMVALPAMTGQATKLIGAFAAILFLYPALAPVLIAASLLLIVVTASLRPLMRKQNRRVRTADEQVMSHMQEDMQQLELIQSLQMEQQILGRFRKKLKNSLSARRNRRVLSVSISSGLSAVSQLGTGAILFWGATRVAVGALSYGALTAMLQLLNMLRAPVVGLSGMWTRFASVEVAAERLEELLALQKPQGEPLPQVGSVQEVVFENVSFHYPGDEAPVLEQFNARYPLNNWACLTGMSGKGKSTVFKLILGLYTPQQGRVYLSTENGHIPCGRQTRHLFAYVPQDYSLFSGTIAENLLLAAPQADETQRKKALQIAQADFVWELTAQEQTQVRENNAGLSKGQLQRLAIARAVLMERPIFLLDECTSALDAQTEAAVLRNLAALGKQAILVTHRPDALENMEQITYIDLEA